MASMYSDETTSTKERLVSVWKSFNVSVGKTRTEDFRKDFSGFRAKLVPLPAFWLQMLGCLDLGAQQRNQRRIIKEDVTRKEVFLK